MNENEIGRLGTFEILERKELLHLLEVEVEIRARSTKNDGTTLTLCLSEDAAAEYADRSRSLSAGSHIEVALLWPEGA